MKDIKEIILKGGIRSFKIVEDCGTTGRSDFYVMPIDYTPVEFEYVDYIYSYPEDNDRLFRDIKSGKTFRHSFGDEPDVTLKDLLF